jgi:peptidoglycan/LPS O-acetylase OafA/YrhL
MRMKHLDTLRAFALLLVMVEHYGGKALNEHIPIGAGSVGVGCFFTLSGFLITGILLESFDANVESKRAVWFDFYARRLLRLVPAFYAVILALVLFHIEPIASSWPWHAAYLTNVWIALGHPDNVFWSLSVEEQFYLFWPFVIAFAPRRYLLHAIAAIVVFSLLFKTGVWLAGFNTRDVNRLLFGNLVLLGAGCTLAVVSYRNGRANHFDWYADGTAHWFKACAWLCLAAAVLSWWFFPKDGGLVRYFTNDLLCGTFYAWVVLQAALGVDGVLKPVFDSAVLQYIGRISYGLYLVHNWMPDIVTKFWGPMPKYEAGPIVVVLTFAVCILSWHFFEKPASRLKRFFWNASLSRPSGRMEPEPEGARSRESPKTARAY